MISVLLSNGANILLLYLFDMLNLKENMDISQIDHGSKFNHIYENVH